MSCCIHKSQKHVQSPALPKFNKTPLHNYQIRSSSIIFSQTLKQLLEELRLSPAELLPPLAYLGVVLVEVVRPPVTLASSTAV